MLESHPGLHYAFVMLFYMIGLLMNVFSAAHLSTSSQNNSVDTLKQYFRLRWLALTVRFVVCIFVFLIGWNNVALGLEKFLDDSLPKHLGMAGFLGFASDEFVSKVLALLGIQKELPPVPQANQP